jgi:predicted lipoprotein with Yx(FWY)xxD motif
MKQTVAILTTAGALVSGVAACGDDGYSNGDSGGGNATEATTTTDSTAPPAQSSRKRQRTTTVKVMNSRYGRVLVDGNGRALYLFTRESSPKSRCYGQCSVAWPPFYARGKLRAGKGADAAKLGSTRRRDGRRIVTYHGHPLYYYVTDRNPGQITCQDVTEFGGTWLVVNPAGNAVS